MNDKSDVNYKKHVADNTAIEYIGLKAIENFVAAVKKNSKIIEDKNRC